MNENQIVTAVIENLVRHAKFKGQFQWLLKPVTGMDGKLSLWVPDDLPVFNIDIKRELRPHQIPQLREMARKHDPFMVMTGKASPAIKEELRNQNINYVDTGGNIFIRHGKTMIWIDGKKTPTNKTGNNKAFTKAGLKLIFYLLLNKEAIHQPYRQLAAAADVATGNIKNIFDGLAEAGFIVPVAKKSYKLENKRELLERWVTAYGEVLRPSLLIETYNFWDRTKSDRWMDLPLETGESMWGGEPGGDLLTNDLVPHKLILYTTENVKLVAKWTLIPNNDGLLSMYRKFWTSKTADQDRHAPPLLVYADLLLTGDPRCFEIAAKIYIKYLKDEFGPS
jgi:hypothetical protein